MPTAPADMKRGKRMARNLGYVIALVVVAGFVTACASDDPEPQTADGLSVIRYAGGTPGTGDAALLTGIARNSGGCLTVEDLVTGVTYAPIFPSSMASPVPDSLVAGDEVALRGGVIDVSPEDSTIPEECSSQSIFWLVVDGP